MKFLLTFLTFCFISALSLSPLAHADYWHPATSGIERLPHYAQQHYNPKAPSVQPERASSVSMSEASQHVEENSSPHSTHTAESIESQTSQVEGQIYGYQADGLPITDFSINVNAFRDEYRQKNPHLFLTKSSHATPE